MRLNFLLKKLCLCVVTLVGTSLFAQYKIDLSRVTSPEITYLAMGNPGMLGEEIRVNNLYLEEGGVPQLSVMGEFHYSRMNPEYWRDALLKMKASGVNIVATYCLWSLHEEREGELSWKGHLDLRRFVSTCKEVGLKVHLRIGPYCNAEIQNGGLPSWLLSNKNLEPRSNDPLYLEYVRHWYEAVYKQVEGLLYKDKGPVMAIQLENEYVKRGQIIPHLTTLKQMAVEIGFDVPLYTMTHWMDSEYPKGEIVPYAGFYIEAPWTTSGKNEMPTSNFEFFTYNRLSDNIGTDIIKLEGDVESLSGKNNESPFFTCEVGVGTTTFYHRRAVVPEEMAGENINLRLGCGANLMGYYMYVGGSNPVGKLSTFQSSGPRISYDYQAPVRETGTLGTIMPEVKKYNYFMNDFGTSLAPAVAYLPTSNQNRENLQWAVRLHENTGYLFCSNYLYRRNRKTFKNVRFQVKLEKETICLPRKKVDIKGGAYFLWPFNQKMNGVLLKYATAQPVCSLKSGSDVTYFFFEDDGIPAEFMIDRQNVKNIRAVRGDCKQEKEAFFIDQLTAGKDCCIEITKNDGNVVRLVTLTEEESDMIWKGKTAGREFVALSPSTLIYDNQNITLIDDRPNVTIDLYKKDRFEEQVFEAPKRNIQARMFPLSPLAYSSWIAPVEGDVVKRSWEIYSFSSVEKAWVRYVTSGTVEPRLNGKVIRTKNMGNYFLGDVTDAIGMGKNTIEYLLSGNQAIAAEIEILMKNGERIVWNTDATWISGKGLPVRCIQGKNKPESFSENEHLAMYEVYVPRPCGGKEETRMYITYKGDVANLYQNGQLTADSYYDGTPWIVSVDRLKEAADVNPIIIRIDGLKSADAPIYFEKYVNPSECVIPVLNGIDVKQEYRFDVSW